MKSKQLKYDEAVERSMRKSNEVVKQTDLNGDRIITTLEKAKHKLGIRQVDSRFDDQLNALLPKKGIKAVLEVISSVLPKSVYQKEA